jgi:hypothetical protein
VNGCLRGAFRLGCAIAAICVLALGWWFREPIMQTVARWFGRPQTLPSTADTTVGAPTPSAVASSQEKVARLERAAGPDSVVLTPNEVASLIGSGIDYNVRKMYDSLRVELQEGRLVIHARLDTRALPPGSLGPFQGMLGPREPLQIGGELGIERPGVARFVIQDISLRGIAFPAPMVKSLARQVAGASPDGAIPFKVDPAVSDLVVHPTGVVLYRNRRPGGRR